MQYIPRHPRVFKRPVILERLRLVGEFGFRRRRQTAPRFMTRVYRIERLELDGGRS